jgi:SulP family sulfate permease
MSSPHPLRTAPLPSASKSGKAKTNAQADRRDRRFAPKLIDALREGYTVSFLRADALAGLTVAIVALPLAMGIAIASGVPPSIGLMTAIFAGIIISALGGSRVQIGGPTAAFAVVVFAVIQKHGLDGLALATLMAGGMLLIAGFLKAGLWLRYIPQSVIVGFTAGIAVTIASTQAGALLGISVPEADGEVLSRLSGYLRHWQTADWATAALGAGGIFAILLLRKWKPQWPGFLLVVVIATTLATLLRLPVEAVGSVFGADQNPFHFRFIEAIWTKEAWLLDFASEKLWMLLQICVN